MNWREQIEYCSLLSAEDLDHFAGPEELERCAASYNKALEGCFYKRYDEAVKILSQVTEDYPLFIEAGHLFALLLAQKGQMVEAAALLKKLTLIAKDSALLTIMKRHLREAEDSSKPFLKAKEAKARREAHLLPIKIEMAQRSILEKADFKRRRREEADPNPSLHLPEQLAKDRKKTALVAMISSVLALMVVLLFFFLVRPGIRQRQAIEAQRKARLAYLEQTLLEQAATSEDVAALLGGYQAWIRAQAGASPTE